LAKKHGLSFSIVEREFRDLDEVLVWVDRNQLGRRNLTDEQRAVVIGRLYKTIKKEPHRPTKEGNGLKLSPFSGSHATARAIAEQVGVGQATVRRAEKFADAVETLQQVSPQAAERVLRGEVRHALTELPKVPEARSFVALANFQRRPTNRASSLPLVALPTDWHCSRPKTLTDRNKRRALQALNNNCWNLLSPSRAQSPYLPKQPHSLGAFAADAAQVIQTSPKEGQLAPFLNQPFAPPFVPSGFEFATLDGTPNGHPRAIEPSRQRVRRQSHKGHLGRIQSNVNSAIQPTRTQHFCRAANHLVLLGFS
jgi:hypothetical protein